MAHIKHNTPIPPHTRYSLQEPLHVLGDIFCLRGLVGGGYILLLKI